MICPKCKEEIEHLNNWVSGERKYRFDGYTYEEEDQYSFGDGKTEDYECPECSEVLFTDEEEATKFLKGEEWNTKKDSQKQCMDLLQLKQTT